MRQAARTYFWPVKDDHHDMAVTSVTPNGFIAIHHIVVAHANYPVKYPSTSVKWT